jgi:Aspartyl/Asparaginyl beta-hydroxylase
MNAAIQANPRKTRSVLHLGPIELGTVRDDILAIPDLVWQRENAAKPNRSYTALDRTEHIIFRFLVNHHDYSRSVDYPIWSEWRERIAPLVAQAIKPYGYARPAFPRMMLARMPAGGRILPHTDANPSARWPHKIHIPISTNPQVRFYVDPEWHHMEVGQAYEVNNLGIHAVENAGDSARIHLIFECYDLDQPPL